MPITETSSLVSPLCFPNEMKFNVQHFKILFTNMNKTKRNTLYKVILKISLICVLMNKFNFRRLSIERFIYSSFVKNEYLKIFKKRNPSVFRRGIRAK